ncbi:stage II sporulation protein [Clostridium sp. CAG:448]|nr:stage II sporulation protein [Clostridium sp. CAG:448]
MTINKISEGSRLTIVIEGRLDTNSSPKLEAELRQSVSGVTELVFDFSGVEYISSAGLRVLLAAQKVMNRQGSMRLVGVSAEVMEVFEITGFADILTIG